MLLCGSLIGIFLSAHGTFLKSNRFCFIPAFFFTQTCHLYKTSPVMYYLVGSF